MPGPSSSGLPHALQSLPTEFAHSIFILNAYLQRLGPRPGPLCHQWLGRWLATGLSTADDLQRLLQEQKDLPGYRPRLFTGACRQARHWHHQGIQAACWQANCSESPRVSARPCPQVLFGLPGEARQPVWAAFFNSRKGKRLHPQDEWLIAFRQTLPRLALQAGGVASSLGTTFYDLVTACAQGLDLSLLLVVPAAIEKIVNGAVSPLLAADRRQQWLLTCHSRAMACSKATRMVCRDRLLACLADLHYILEIRAGGNLQTVLREQQQTRPRPQWIYSPKHTSAHNAGNLQLLKEFPEWTRVFEIAHGSGAAASKDTAPPFSPSGTPQLAALAWQDYLYHYTRACPGPWPGQSYRDYLYRLFNNDPFSAHTALDTLIRILYEGRIRSSCNLVRGDRPVVSWSARPPLELQKLRKWNPALIRWTFEPYGLAVHRRLLRRRGAQPAIYTTPENYSRLPPDQRFRFQRHQPPRCSWKVEREWRLPGDFALESVTPTDGFIFVPDAAARQRVVAHVKPLLPIIVLQNNKIPVK